MPELSARNLMDLTVAAEDSDAQIEQIYDWEHHQQMTVASWALGVSASLMIGLYLAYAGSEAATAKAAAMTPHLIILGFSGGVCSLAYGSWRLWRIGKMYQHYIGALLLLSRFREIKPFLIRYRSDPEARPWT